MKRYNGVRITGAIGLLKNRIWRFGFVVIKNLYKITNSTNPKMIL